MGFLKIIKQKKFTLISILLFFYVILNLLDGDRGLISYYEKLKIKKQLIQEHNLLSKRLDKVENENNLLTDVIDADYLETLYREKFMVGKKNEKVFIYK
jgi:cell division protein FtsB